MRSYDHARCNSIECGEFSLIIPFGRSVFLPRVVEFLEAEEIRDIGFTDREFYRSRHEGLDITIVYSGMGSPLAANALEAIKRNGGTYGIIFGGCGAVRDDIAVGDVVIPQGAVRGEGTSRYYAPEGYPAVFDTGLVWHMLREAGAADRDVHTGIVYTTDASYRETDELIATIRGACLAIECECAAAAVVGRVIGLRTAAVLFCTDNLVNHADRHISDLSVPAVESGFEEALKLVIRAMKTVSGAGENLSVDADDPIGL